jgi:hypothetical protein
MDLSILSGVGFNFKQLPLTQAPEGLIARLYDRAGLDAGNVPADG